VSFMWFPEHDNRFKLKKNSTFIDGNGKPTKDSKTSSPRLESQNTGGVKEAAQDLCKLIDPNQTLKSPFGPRHPLVILAFDEAHVLTNNPADQTYNVFIELRRVLRSIVNEPIFSLFLTTAGSFQRFSPNIRSDPSSRVTNENLPTLHPISEISFDTLAYSAKDNEVSLQRVTQTDWIARLGRPLCVDYTYSRKSS
jgi:hypothetical protein